MTPLKTPLQIYHNPRCSKSCETLELLRSRGLKPQVIEYLKTPPDERTLEQLLRQLCLEPRELMRQQEDLYTELGLHQGEHRRQELIRLMVEHPILIERPIVVCGEHARLGRPPQQVLEIL